MPAAGLLLGDDGVAVIRKNDHEEPVETRLFRLPSVSASTNESAFLALGLVAWCGAPIKNRRKLYEKTKFPQNPGPRVQVRSFAGRNVFRERHCSIL
jgi:hypothetical protein